MDLVKDDSKKAYSVQFNWPIYSLPKGKNYTICVDPYQTDQWLFEHAEVTFTHSSYGVTVGNVKITKHTHEYNGQHILYYHKIEVQTQRWATSPPTYVFVNYNVNNVTDWYSPLYFCLCTWLKLILARFSLLRMRSSLRMRTTQGTLILSHMCERTQPITHISSLTTLVW